MTDATNPGRAAAPMLIVPAVALVGLIVARLVYPGLLQDTSLSDFLLVSLVLGGAAAWRTGEAVARGWGSYAHLVIYGALLTAAVRFCHFALFEDNLFSLQNFVVEFVLLMSIATLGYRSVRRRQMTVQYGWLFEPDGPMAWRQRR